MSRVANNHVSDFFNWWGRELTGLLPSGLRLPANARGPSTIVSQDQSKIDVIEERGRSSRVVATAKCDADAALAGVASVVDTIATKSPVGIRVPLGACFSRTLDIPEAARADALQLAVLDLERATPFRTADVMTAVYVDDSVKPVRGRIALRQLVLKRATVAEVRIRLAERGIDVARIDCWNSDRTAALPVDFLLGDAQPAAGGRARSAFLNRLLTATAAGAAVAALALVVIKHENALAIIDQETASARSLAADVGQRIARSEAVLADAGRLAAWRRSRPLGVEILGEVTRLLPDGAHLTEFNLDGDQLDLTGFAASAAPLLEAFERSARFTDARFTTPFRLEPRDDRERFSMRVRLRPASGAPVAETQPRKG